MGTLRLPALSRRSLRAGSSGAEAGTSEGACAPRRNPTRYTFIMTVPTALRRAASWRRIGLWLAVAAACWLAARACERHTLLSIVSTGSRIEVAADSSSIAVPLTVDSVRRIEVVATTSAFAPGGRTLTVTQGPSTVLVDRLPARFELPRGEAAPVGDWEIDDHAGTGLGYARDIALAGPFELAAVFTGRPQQHLLVNFVGTPSFSVSFRRGLINNDLFVWDSDWRPLAVTSIDPQPGSGRPRRAGDGPRPRGGRGGPDRRLPAAPAARAGRRGVATVRKAREAASCSRRQPSRSLRPRP